MLTLGKFPDWEINVNKHAMVYTEGARGVTFLWSLAGVEGRSIESALVAAEVIH